MLKRPFLKQFFTNTPKLHSPVFVILFSVLFISACAQQPIQQPESNLAETTSPAIEKIELSPTTRLDTWERIRAGFNLPDVEHKRIEQELNWFKRHPNYMNRVVERARPYLHYIIETVEAAGLPSELALLPIVESAFQPFAYSHGRAAGIWQFIPATGKRYGLKQNWWYDGRRDIHASTIAAVKLLKILIVILKAIGCMH